MHYAPIISSQLVGGRAEVRDRAQRRVRQIYTRQAASWSNWWNMSVAAEPTRRTPAAPRVGSRGRLPGV